MVGTSASSFLSASADAEAELCKRFVSMMQKGDCKKAFTSS